MFHCGQCSYKSKRKYDVGRHEKAMHGDFKKNYMVNHGNDGGNNYGQSHKHVYNELKNFDIRLKENFKLFVSGPSRCGKTVFVSKLIENIKSFATSLQDQSSMYIKYGKISMKRWNHLGLISWKIMKKLLKI